MRVQTWFQKNYLLVRTSGPGIAVWLLPGQKPYSERVHPTWLLWNRWVAVRLFWGLFEQGRPPAKEDR